MAEQIQRYTFEKVRDEANRIQDLVGERASGEDIETAHALINEEDESPDDAEFDNIKAGTLPQADKEELKVPVQDGDGSEADVAAYYRQQAERLEQELLTPERMDFLTSIIKDRLPDEQKQEIIHASYDDLVDLLGGPETPELKESLLQHLSEVMQRRETMIDNIDAYICDQRKLPKQLRDHQLNALIKIRDFIADGYQRGYITHPTGAGKTVLFSSLIKAAQGRSLIIVPSKQLVQQTIDALKAYFPESQLSFVSGSRNHSMGEAILKGSHGEVVVSTDESVKLNCHGLLENDFNIVVWDEAHNSYTAKAQEALRHFPSAIKIAFSATPDFYYLKNGPGFQEVQVGDQTLYLNPEKTGAKYFPHEIDSITLRDAIERGLLTDMQGAIVKIDIDFSSIRTTETEQGIDLNKKDLSRILEKHWPTLKDTVMQSFTNGVAGRDESERIQFNDRKIVAICANKAQAGDLAVEFKRHGVSAQCITGDTPDEQRNQWFEQYRTGALQVLTSVNVLKEGWDMPEAEVLLMLRPTISRVFYQQALGRVLRLDSNNPDKKALVVDFQGKFSRMELMNAPQLFGIAEKDFHNGEMMVDRPRDKTTTTPDHKNIEGDPLAVTPVLESLETIGKEDHIAKAEKVRDGILRQNKDIFCNLKLMKRIFHVAEDSLSSRVDIANMLTIQEKNTKYYHAKEVMAAYLNHPVSQSLQGMLVPVSRIAKEFKIDEKLLLHVAKKNNLTSERSGKQVLYSAERLWQFTKKEIERRLNLVISNPESVERLFWEEMDLTQPDQLVKAFKQMADQTDHAGIRETLERIREVPNRPEVEELLRKIQQKGNGFPKIVRQCERLLLQLAA